MFAALLLALAPLPCTALGSPCVCFPIQHGGTETIPDDPLDKSGWTPKRVLDETLRTVRGTDDVFLRADTLRTAVRVLRPGSADAPPAAESTGAARKTLFEELSLDLKSATELAPYSSTTLELTGDLDAARARLQALPGVVRVERASPNTALRLWFDAQKLSAERLQEASRAATAPTIEPPTRRGHALAAITLAFAGQSSKELGYGALGFDPPALAREAVSFQPKDARIALIAGMVWFDGDSRSSARFVRDAIHNAQDDEYVAKNLISIFGAFYDTRTVLELAQKLDRELEKG